MANAPTRGSSQTQSQTAPTVRVVKIHPILKTLGYVSTTYMLVVGILMLIGKMFDGSVPEIVTTVTTTVFVIAGLLNYLAWALANSLGQGGSR